MGQDLKMKVRKENILNENLMIRTEILKIN